MTENRLELGHDGLHEIQLPLDRVEVAVQLGSKALLQVAHTRLDIPRGAINYRDLGFDATVPGMLVEDRHDFDWSTHRHMILPGLRSLPEGRPVRVGRLLDPQFVTFDDDVSRVHTEFILTGNEISVRDLDSTNGTTVIWTPRQQVRQEQQPSNEMLNLTASGLTNPSEDHPDHNDDNYFVDAERGVFGVFDGVSAQSGSDLASSLAADVLRRYSSSANDPAFVTTTKERLVNTLNEANREIQDRGTDWHEIMTTATAMEVFRDVNGDMHGVVAWAGDSRAYLWRDSQLTMLTIDDAGSMQGISDDRRMQIQARLASATSYDDFPEDSMLRGMFYHRSAVTQVLGARRVPLNVHTQNVRLRAGDVLLLTTDGIHDNLTTDEMADCLRTMTNNPGEVSDSLMAAALARSREGGFRSKPDDMTAVVVRI